MNHPQSKRREPPPGLLTDIARLRTDQRLPRACEAALWERYGRTVAALVLDTSGFSRTAARYGIVHCLSLVLALREICTEVCDRHCCTSLRFEADNVFAIFRQVDPAIGCASEIHRQLFASGLRLSESERLRVSIGIGYGRMLYAGDRESYFSSEMNLTSKLGEDIADGDETLLTECAHASATPANRKPFRPGRLLISGIDLGYYYCKFDPEPRPVSSA